MTIRSATWPARAHSLDIMVWISDSDLAGPITVEGTGIGSHRGAVRYGLRLGREMPVRRRRADENFKQSGADVPGADSTKFIGSDGWLDLRRHSIDSEPKSLVANIKPDNVSPERETRCIVGGSSRR